jgi:hypothetical protein
LKTRNRRLETITNLVIKTLANLEKEVEEGRFYHEFHDTNNKQKNPFDRLTSRIQAINKVGAKEHAN